MYLTPINTPFDRKAAPMSKENQKSSPSQSAQAARGLELMAQRDNLIYQGASAESPEQRAEILERLEAWHNERTDEDWKALALAEYGSGKAGRRKLVSETVTPVGRA